MRRHQSSSRLSLLLVMFSLTACTLANEPSPSSSGNRHASNGLIAYTLRDQNGHLQIFTNNEAGTDRHQLTYGVDHGLPAWSPDGTRLSFMSQQNGSPQIWTMAADGSNQQALAQGEGGSWSHDGTQIAYSAGGEILVMNADGSSQRRITRSGTFKSRPTWSPDGKEMAFIELKNPGSPTDAQPTIGIMNADGTNERILTTQDRTNVQVAPDGTETVLETARDANAPCWAYLGKQIAFWSGIESRYGQVWTINADGSGSRQLTADPTHRNNDDPCWSPDGTKILFSSGRGGRNQLWEMAADGSNQRMLFDIDAAPFPGRASWQPVVV